MEKNGRQLCCCCATRERDAETHKFYLSYFPTEREKISDTTRHTEKIRARGRHTGFDALLAAAGRDWSRSRTEVISRVVTTRYISRSSVCAVLCGPASYTGGPYTTSIVNTAEKTALVPSHFFIFFSLVSSWRGIRLESTASSSYAHKLMVL